MPIPISSIVTINPGVISAGGSAVALNGLILTQNPAVPIGTVMSLVSLAAVQAFFGAGSTEASLAANYFSGPDNSLAKPAALLFAQYPSAAVGAYLRSASLASMTLAALKALTGVLTISVNGTPTTSSAINLSAATSFSNAATIIQAAFTTPGFTVSFDSVRNAFVFANSTTGATSAMSFASGTLAAPLMLDQADGAVLSQGAAAATPATFMPGVIMASRNWVGFMTAFEPVIADKLAFSAWASGTNNRFAYVAWDTDASAVNSGNTTSFGPQVASLNYANTVPIWGAGSSAHAAFFMGIFASVDFTRRNSRVTSAFKTQSGLAPTVTDATTAANLRANGYNYYGQYASSTSSYNIFYPGTISGSYMFADEFYDEVWLNSAFEAAMIALLLGVPSIPYNQQGYALIDAAMADPIAAAVNAGVIRENVPLSSLQAAEVNNQAGTPISTVLSSRGWYLQILPAPATVRAARQSPPITFWYMDGGAIQQISIASLVVQ